MILAISSGSRSRHIPAGFSATGARIGALLHQLIVAHSPALALAGLADFGANRARARMKRGPAQHEARARAAYLRAVSQRSNVLWFGVFAAHFEAMLSSLFAQRITAHALLDAFLHFLGDGVLGSLHPSSSVSRDRRAKGRRRWLQLFRTSRTSFLLFIELVATHLTKAIAH